MKKGIRYTDEFKELILGLLLEGRTKKVIIKRIWCLSSNTKKLKKAIDEK